MDKKKILSTSTGLVIASLLLGVGNTEAASYKVEKGDSLWLISQKYGTTVSKLKELNNLHSTFLFPNQVLEVGSNSSSVVNNYRSSASDSKLNSGENSSNITNQYIVKAGDTLWEISQQFNVSVSNLKEWNNLKSDFIYIGQTLKIQGMVTTSIATSGNSTNTVTSSENSSTHKVKAGDTLTKISKIYGVTISDLKAWNSLKSDIIYVGQSLTINGKKRTSEKSSVETNKSTSTSDVDYDVNKVISIARSLVGTPYVWGGSSLSGFDCSGFVYYVYKQAGMDLNRLSAAGYYDRSYYVENPLPGDLIFFENTYKKGISDVGIYLGNNQFISSASKSVSIKSLDNPYWKSHFDSFKRFY